MIVCIPVCQKDLPAAIRNIEWAKELDGSCNFPCLISHEIGFDVSSLVPLARTYFSAVQLFQYPAYPKFNNQKWPRPQNWAWRRLALHIGQAYKEPWLWWEQDAVPIKAGWLAALHDAYVAGGRPFMGAVGTNASPSQGDHLNGVAIYPHNWSMWCPESMLFSDALAFDVCGGWRVLKMATITPLIQHLWSFENHAGGPACTFPNHTWLSHVSKQAVLFHRCKDGSLIEQIRQRPIRERKPRSLIPKRRMRRKWERVSPTIEQVNATSDVTVVITNFQRADMLWNAYQSCKRAKVAHIAIASAGVTPQVQDVLDQIADDSPHVAMSAKSEDDGCNLTWLRGADLVRTSMMTILHDDDLLTPAYENVVAGKHHADVIHWDGKKHTPKGSFPGIYVTRSDLPEGVHPITFLLPLLLAPQYNTLSPVSGCYPTQHVLDCLRECESNYGPWAYLRPTMMVGNDSMIWLRACERFKTVYYSHVPYNSYGHWEGSASFDDATQHRGKLLPIYQSARDYFIQRAPNLIHVVPRYVPKEQSTAQRISAASATWDYAYNFKIVKSGQMWKFPRDSSSIGEPQQTPFLKDLLRPALDIGKENDLIVMTNDDTLLSIYWWFSAWHHLKSNGAGCSFRRNITVQSEFIQGPFPRKTLGKVNTGRDAFCFTKAWLSQHIEEIPDYLLGFGDWDSTLAMLIRLSAGEAPRPQEFTIERPVSEVPNGLVFHVDHEARWANAPNAAGMLYNRSLTNEFFAKRLGWEMPKLRGTW